MLLNLPRHKTKIVCTIGPACRSRAILQKMIISGMNVARLNFSHGDLKEHERDILTIKDLSNSLGKTVAILGDLPGPKIRIGSIENGSCMLERGRKVVLTTRNITGTPSLIPVQYAGFIQNVTLGSRIFLNDGFIQLKVLNIQGEDVSCRIITSGMLLSHKGMNLPDARLDVNPVTKRDLEYVRFGLDAGVDLFSVSFAKHPDDILLVKAFAEDLGKKAFVVAKIERKEALEKINDIIDAADAIMIARGDLGVEIPIEKVPITQKQLILKASYAAKPVITATQMLESMTVNTRPTRAEVTDVANAIFDGTDAVMLSEETAIGDYPLDAVKMLAKIARAAENHRHTIITGISIPDAIMREVMHNDVSIEDILSLDVANSLSSLNIRYVLVPSISGATARRISRFKTKAWILALCCDESTQKRLNLSYGVHPIIMPESLSDEDSVVYLKEQKLVKPNDILLMVQGLPFGKIGRENSFKIIKLD
jgi:pyruvate kinase